MRTGSFGDGFDTVAISLYNHLEHLSRSLAVPGMARIKCALFEGTISRHREGRTSAVARRSMMHVELIILHIVHIILNITLHISQSIMHIEHIILQILHIVLNITLHLGMDNIYMHISLHVILQ